MNILLIFPIFLLYSRVFAIWPRPQKLATGDTPLRLDQDFTIQTSGIDNVPSDVSDAIERTTGFLKTDKLQLLVPDRGASLSDTVNSANTLRSLTLTLTSSSTGSGGVKSISEEAIQELGTQDESYTLQVPGDDGGNAVLNANTTLGLFRGLTTFEQLWFDLEGTVYTLQAPVQIEDAPTYVTDDIKRTLDAMSWVKINHFHWHVVDSQSFPIVVPGFEEISQKGAYSSSKIYTPDDVEDIVQYAAARGIDVMVEIDTPGHTSVISKSHPEHIACPESTPWSRFAGEPPAGQLRLATPSTVNFTANLIGAVSSMFPSKLFHTGGDEINTNCYDQDEQTQMDLNSQGKTFEQALDAFTQATHSVLVEEGKTPVVWEEMALEHQVQLRNNTIVLVWISSQHVGAVAQKGFKIIHAASDFFYLDCGAGGWIGDNVDGDSSCGVYKTWQRAYSFNPVAGLESDQEDLILGGQQLLWAEQSGPSNLDSIAWPRSASSAELFWSGPGGDVKTALPRLHETGFRFVQRGVNAIPLQPEWCALRPNACDAGA
ncbi:hypothetical protein AGABI2DRAFT_188060 [Agaricus bisporus var. bisporus H97]|uniref:hypothetical protein n=1 Tax=Agaricus bisporus var. bisporus (strain H97 / ATCC MYA-4626 / FGSC 10389) TaxID=936046 RepID=UPI00029F71E6|nr:hypothetical protein AGABI2DRAFT_188060 [Agaricus bisporus var. bisporus H97]EKV43735.1 hypothetical protein AGABI2DRAFT_188060 [Agaricus bisporus var. bisporus H97]